MSLDPKLLELLACPKCKGPLEEKLKEKEGNNLQCQSCQVAYPITDGIPRLLKEAAVDCSPKP